MKDKNKIITGDCLDVMKDIPENSVDAIITDPPYGLSFMGKKWDYDVPSVEIWQECLRVLKPGGYLLAFAGTRTQHRMAVRIEDAGFEIRDMIAWVYGSGFPKSLNIGKAVDKIRGNERKIVGEIRAGKTAMGQNSGWNDHANRTVIDSTKGTSEWEGWGTALKPALEPITVARKPLSEKSVAENVLRWGTGGINIDGSRVSHSEEVKTTNRQKNNGDTWNSENTGLRNNPGDIASASPLGRFPANLIHDGSDDVVGLFPKAGKGSGGKPYNYAGKEYDNKKTSMFNGDKPQAPSNFNDSGSASRFFYCAKASKSERDRGLQDMEEKKWVQWQTGNGASGKPSSISEGRNTTYRNFHPTVKPVALMEYLVKLVSREGVLVLDPFTGSGSTGIACKNLGREFIGIELDPEYCKIAKKRIEAWKVKPQQLTI